MTAHFPILILNGRPASGKSEIINYLKNTASSSKLSELHLGTIHDIDDFPMLWTWFEEDHLLESVFDRPRIHTDAEGYFLHEDLWHLLIERLSMDYAKLVRDNPQIHDDHTVLIEFSRGSEHGGYEKAYPHLSDTILQQAAILYVDVPYEESLRKNRRRFNPDRPDSILEHGLPDNKLERLYKEVDWHEVSKESPETIDIKGVKVPYAVFHNEDDVTTEPGKAFEERVQSTLKLLWQRWQSQHE